MDRSLGTIAERHLMHSKCTAALSSNLHPSSEQTANSQFSGRYGHGAIPHDRFEKSYYEKHPELSKKELGQYGEGKPEWALSSEDLNKLVRDTASRGTGLGKENICVLCT